MSNWPSLLNIGSRTWDANGSICRPSDKFNERRAIVIMKARFPDLAQYDYWPAEQQFAAIDGQWLHNGFVKAFSEIKSHAGKTMGRTTILNLRKWQAMVALQSISAAPVIFIAQYENAVGFQNVEKLTKIVADLEPVTITDTKSAHRNTSTEAVWKIPTDLLSIIEPRDAVIPVNSLNLLNEWARKIYMEEK